MSSIPEVLEDAPYQALKNAVSVVVGSEPIGAYAGAPVGDVLGRCRSGFGDRQWQAPASTNRR